MILKRYIVDNMQEGMEKIKKELGSDAVILSSKEIKKKGLKGLFSKPKLEVVAAYDDKEISIHSGDAPVTRRKAPKQSMSSAASAYSKNTSAPVQDNSDLEAKITNIDSMLNNFLQRFESNYNDKFANYSKEVRNFASKMLENEVKEDITYKLADEVSDMVKKENIEEKTAIEKVVTSYLGEAKPFEFNENGPTIIMFLGTTGVGKTTTLSKLATMFTMQQEKSVAIITTDTYKIASSEQLKIYSEILSVPLTVAYSNDEIPAAMESYKDKDVIFIDTGKCPDEAEYRGNITKLIEITQPDNIYIVVSANTNYKFCMKTLADYNYVKDYKFIVTKMDEAMSVGTLFNLRSLSAKPVTYLTYGQILTEDIREYSPEYILEKLLGNDEK